MTKAENSDETFRLEVDDMILVEFETVERRMRMTLVDLSEQGCRLRSTACVPVDRVSFNWTGPSTVPIRLYGEIVDSKITEGKVPECGVRFEMPVVERDRLAAELHEIQRRAVFKTLEPITEASRTRRQGYRAPIKFPVTVRVPGRGKTFQAEANDLSIGGMLLGTTDDIPDGTIVQAEFELPISEIDPDEAREAERKPAGPRDAKKVPRIRPFEPFDVKLKIVKRIGSTPTGYSFGTAFHEISAFSQEEIARFVHAYQLAQLRKAAELEK